MRLRWAVLSLALACAAGAQPDAAGLVRSTVGAEADALSLAIETATSEAEVLAKVPAIEAFADAPREMLRLDAATRLADLGTSDSLPVLQRWSALEAEVTTLVDGCRTQVEVPVFDFSAASTSAEARVSRRLMAATLRRRLGDDAARWANTLASPATPGTIEAVGELPAETSREVVRRMISIADDSEAAVAAAIVVTRADLAPPAVRFPDLMAQQLYAHRADLSPKTWSAIETRVTSLPGVASRARAEKAQAVSLDAQLALWPEGAVAASEKPALALKAKASNASKQRAAVLALMLQDSVESRAALKELAESGALDAELAGKVAAWLGK